MIQTSVAGGTVRLRIEIAAEHQGLDMSLTADEPHGPRPVRGWVDVPAPAIAVVIDHEPVLNVSVRYDLLVEGVVVDSVTVTVPADQPLVGDPVRGVMVPAIIKSWPERTHERPTAVLHVARRHDPVVIDAVERLATSKIELIYTDPAAADRASTLLADQSVLHVRPSCPHMAPAWVSAGNRTRRRFSTLPDSAVVDTIDLVHVAQPELDRAAVGNTLGDLHRAEPGTLQDIADRWPTLADIAFEDLSA